MQESKMHNATTNLHSSEQTTKPVQPRPSTASVYTIQVCIDSTPRHCNTVLGKIQALLLRAAMQTRLTAGLCHCKHICMKYCSSYRWEVAQQQCTATLLRAKCFPHWSVQCKPGSQQACDPANTPMNVYCLCRSLVTQYQCTAILKGICR